MKQTSNNINPPKHLREATAKAISKAVDLLYSVDAVDYNEVCIVKSALKSLAKSGELPAPPEEKLVSQEQVAEVLGVGLSTLKRLLASGEVVLPRKMVGGSVRYRWKDVVSWMNAPDETKEATIRQ